MKYMRMVALTANIAFIQTSEFENRGFKQDKISWAAFNDFMKEEFPQYWVEYESTNKKEEAAEYFYHYGETDEMKRKGIAYVFAK